MRKRQFEVTATYWGGRIRRSAIIEAETPQMAALTAVWKRRIPKEYRHNWYSRIPLFWFAGTPEKEKWPHPIESKQIADNVTSVTVVWGGDEETAGLLELTVTEIIDNGAANSTAHQDKEAH
jgi:hypothetical protein